MKVYVVKVVDGWTDEMEIISVHKTKEGALKKMSELYDGDDDDDGGAFCEILDLED
jgi:hypothetical protein